MINLNQPTSFLEYAIKDCYEAISAYPQGYKTPDYFATAKAYEIEINRREGVQNNREISRTNGIDPLKGRDTFKQRRYLTDYSKKCFLQAAFYLGFNKLQER